MVSTKVSLGNTKIDTKISNEDPIPTFPTSKRRSLEQCGADVAAQNPMSLRDAALFGLEILRSAIPATFVCTLFVLILGLTYNRNAEVVLDLLEQQGNWTPAGHDYKAGMYTEGWLGLPPGDVSALGFGDAYGNRGDLCAAFCEKLRCRNNVTGISEGPNVKNANNVMNVFSVITLGWASNLQGP